MSEMMQKTNRLIMGESPSHSPCVGYCTDDEAGYCFACRRHRGEIDGWRDIDPMQRSAIWDRLPQAIDGGKFGVMRLPLDPEHIADIAAETLKGGGSWAVGARGHWLYGRKMARRDGLKLVANGGDTKGGDKGAEITLDLSGNLGGKIRALAWARDGKTFSQNMHDLPLIIVTPMVKVNLPDDLFGLPTVRFFDEREGQRVQVMCASAYGFKPQKNKPENAVPRGLDLPDSYAISAFILPKGQAALD